MKCNDKEIGGTGQFVVNNDFILPDIYRKEFKILEEAIRNGQKIRNFLLIGERISITGNHRNRHFARKHFKNQGYSY